MKLDNCSITECNNLATITFSINAWYGGIRFCEDCYKKYLKNQEAREKVFQDLGRKEALEEEIKVLDKFIQVFHRSNFYGEMNCECNDCARLWKKYGKIEKELNNAKADLSEVDNE